MNVLVAAIDRRRAVHRTDEAGEFVADAVRVCHGLEVT
jgi:hypothetical protein